MIDALLLIAAWFSAFLGAALIALTNRAHRAAVGYAAETRHGGRGNGIFGGLSLVLTTVLAILRDGFGMGLLLAPLLIATGMATVIGILAVRPNLLHRRWTLLAMMKRIRPRQ